MVYYCVAWKSYTILSVPKKLRTTCTSVISCVYSITNTQLHTINCRCCTGRSTCYNVQSLRCQAVHDSRGQRVETCHGRPLPLSLIIIFSRDKHSWFNASSRSRNNIESRVPEPCAKRVRRYFTHKICWPGAHLKIFNGEERQTKNSNSTFYIFYLLLYFITNKHMCLIET